MVGAVERVVGMAVDHARNREQFGRPLSRFQVIQHALAEAAEEVAAARASVDVALRAWAGGDADLQMRTTAVAKLRTGRAAMRCARIAHQVHGAVGVTMEHPLHVLTTRLSVWRDECGGEAAWALELGRAALCTSARDLWPSVTGTVA
jgi:acyl-CoA dehydrogenase